MSWYFWTQRAVARRHSVVPVCAAAAVLLLGLVGRSARADEPLGIVVDTTSVSVAEGGTGTLGVKLSAQPVAGILVNVTRIDGDADISVQAGATLTFTPANWDTYQTVTLAAAQDGDVVNGQATIRCSAIGLTAVTVMAHEADNDTQGIDIDQDRLPIPEGGMVSFDVRLTAQPGANVTVAVERVSGDADVQLVNGALALTFTPENWKTYQRVSLFAVQDTDTVVGEALIRCSIAGGAERLVTVREVEDDTLRIVTDVLQVNVMEGGTATFRVKLNAPLTEDLMVRVQRLSGDTDVDVQSGGDLLFTPANWNLYQTVTLAAGFDEDTVNGQVVIVCIGAPAVWCGIVAVEVEVFVEPEEDPPDETPPTVEIVSQETSGATVAISGTATDNVGVAAVLWENNRVGAGRCGGTENWSATKIALVEGENRISVTATDAAGNFTTKTISVMYTPPPPEDEGTQDSRGQSSTGEAPGAQVTPVVAGCGGGAASAMALAMMALAVLRGTSRGRRDR